MNRDPETDFYKIQQWERAQRDSFAHRYEDFVMKTRGELWDRIEKEALIRALHPQSDEMILDAGCGVGRHSVLLAKKGKKVISADFSIESLRNLNLKVKNNGISKLQVLTTDLSQPLPFKECSFDKVLVSQVLQHIPCKNKRQDLLKELNRILKPGGRLVFSVYRWGGEIRFSREGFWDNGLYRYAFTSGECRQLLKNSGFYDIRVKGMMNIPKTHLIPKGLWEPAVYTELLFEILPFSTYWGKSLLVCGRKGFANE